MGLIPGQPQDDAEMQSDFDDILGQQPGGPPALLDAMQMAEGGDPLELDLAMSGFYGEDYDPAGGMEDDARHEIGARALGDFLARLREEAVQRRWGVDENTLLNQAFRHGHHYVEVDPGRRAAFERPAPKDAVRRKVQKFEPWYRQHHSRLSSGMPDYQTRPNHRSQDALDAARFAESLSDWQSGTLFSFDNRAEIAMWKLLAGTAIVFTGIEWIEDPAYMVDQGAVDPETGAPAPVRRPVFVDEVLPPQMFWCDDRLPTITKMRWAGRDRFVPISEARGLHPQFNAKLMPEDVASSRGHSVLRRSQQLVRTEDPFHGAHLPIGTGGMDVEEERETVLCEWYGKKGIILSINFLDWLDPELVTMNVLSPSGELGGVAVVEFPEGLRVTFLTDGTVLEACDNFYEELPFRESRFSKGPGFWGYAPATPMRELQMAFNWTFSMREAHAIKTGNAPLLQPREARVHRRGGLTAAFGRMLYRANRWGAKPEWMSPPSMSVDIAALQEALESAWQDIGGIHEVSQAKLPSADISGVTVSLLQEQDLQQLGYAGDEQEAAYIDLMRMRLRQIQKFLPSSDPRLVKLAGDSRYQLEAFMRVDLTDAVDLQVVKGSAIPRSPAAVEAKAKEAWQLGFMVDHFGRPDVRKMQTIFGMATSEALYEEENVDYQNARTIEDMILSMPPEELALVVAFIQTAGMLPESLLPRPEDDPYVHERSHRLRLKRIQNDPRVEPAAVECLRLRWKMVLGPIAQLMMQTDPDVIANAMGGAPGQDGGAGAEGGPPQSGEQQNPQPAANAA